jgi:hypothetical protein
MMDYRDPDQLRAWLGDQERLVARQREELEHLNGREYTHAYWRIRARERRLAVIRGWLEDMEESVFFLEVWADINRL